MNPSFQRLALLMGEPALEKLSQTRVIVFGVGGVGSWTAEALARSGIGKIALVDSDSVCITNCNRQLQADRATVGQPKVDALKNRLLAINPLADINAFPQAFTKESADLFELDRADYVIDAIDSLTHKIDLIALCGEKNRRLFSSMGTAMKLDPSQLKTADLWETKVCPLARLVRQGLRKRGFSGKVQVVYSEERLPLHTEIQSACGSRQCLCPARSSDNASPEWCASKKVINGSCVTVTGAAGLMLASLVLQDVYHSFSHAV